MKALSAEKEAVRELGARIGYGNMMHLAQECWRELLITQGLEGGEFSLGPCVSLVGKSHLDRSDIRPTRKPARKLTPATALCGPHWETGKPARKAKR